MAEQVQRHRQYEYRANSNLVLTTEHARGSRNDEPSGEPESLKDHLQNTKFGDRVAYGKPDVDGGARKRKAAAAAAAKADATKRTRKDGATVLDLGDDLDTYRPRSKETRGAYEELLSLISQQLGDQPNDILRGAADEVLACLKNDSLTDPERKREVEKLINSVSPEAFAKYVDAGKRITDFMAADGAGDDKLDDELGVAVVFDEDDDDDEQAGAREGRREDDEVGNVVDEELSEDEAGLETQSSRALNRGADDEEAEGEDGGDELPLASIDAYWLQRECARYFNDPLVAQKTAADVLDTLGEAEERDAENRLVILLDYDKFDLIKLLLRHRWKIAVCTRLAQAQSDDERARLLAEMEEHPQMGAVLDARRAAASKTDEIFTETKQLEARVRKETGELRKLQTEAESAGQLAQDLLAPVQAGAKARVGKTVLDLESLAFEDGGHLMANKKCQLPPGSFRTQKKGYEEVGPPDRPPSSTPAPRRCAAT